MSPIDLALSFDGLHKRWSNIFSVLMKDIGLWFMGDDEYQKGQLPKVQHNDTNEEIYTEEIGWLSVQQTFELMYGFSMGTGVMGGMSLDQCTGSF